MPRKRTGQLIWRPSGWHGRFWIVVDGEEVRVRRPLGVMTPGPAGRAVAKRKLARLLAEGVPAVAQNARETVDEYAQAWLANREAKALQSAEYERRHYEHVWRGTIGASPLGDVRAQHIREVLEAVADGTIKGQRTERYSRATLVHIRDTALRLFEAAWRDEIIPDNPVKRVVAPEVVDDRPEKARSILTDEEFAMLMQCPTADAEIKVMALLARTVGGMRAGDLVALTWEAFDPEFTTCTIVRRKTRKKNRRPTPLDVPAPVRPFLSAWKAMQAAAWKDLPGGLPRHLFPSRKGPRAGQPKLNSNVFAARLRRELKKAGVDRHELHHETSTTLPADFHSCRRAFATALARVGVNEQTAMLLTGHSDAKVHRRYLNELTLKTMPEAAVPALGVGATLWPLRSEPANETGVISGGRSRDRTCDFDRVKVALYR